MPRDLPAKYDDLDLLRLRDRATVMADNMIKKYKVHSIDAEDLVHDAVLELHLKWDPSLGTALGFMATCMKNDVFDHLRRASYRTTDTSLPENIHYIKDNRKNQEEIIIEEQEENSYLEYIKSKGIPLCLWVAEWIVRHDLKTSKEIAEKMNMKGPQVDYAKKKLRVFTLDYFVKNGLSHALTQRLLNSKDGVK